jgi:hypothetical protein
VPLSYEPGWWSIVFPVGMYGVASHLLGAVLGVSCGNHYESLCWLPQPAHSGRLLEQPCLVGEHDRLDPVAQAEFLEDVRDVCFHSRLAYIELVADLRVG